MRLANSDLLDSVQSERLRIEDVLTVWWVRERKEARCQLRRDWRHFEASSRVQQGLDDAPEEDRPLSPHSQSSFFLEKPVVVPVGSG